MKKSTLFIAFVLLIMTVSAQTTLTYEKHALIPGELNEMVLVNYSEPGNSGANQIWDFSGLKVENDFEGTIGYVSKSLYMNDFNQSNSILEEFGNKFFFNVQKDKIETYGMVSKSGKTIIKYDQPFVKMKYPFAYGASFDGEFSGMYGTDERKLGDIQGEYKVSADGYGTLILPGVEYKNTLRVNSYREMTRSNGNYSYKIIHDTYRWYVEDHRFPVLVLTTTKIINKDKVSKSHQAALNSNVVQEMNNNQLANVDFKMYPNPVTEELNLTYRLNTESKVLVRLIDLSGKVVDVLLDKNLESGNYKDNYILNSSIKAGNYLLDVHIGSERILKPIIVIK